MARRAERPEATGSIGPVADTLVETLPSLQGKVRWVPYAPKIRLTGCGVGAGGAGSTEVVGNKSTEPAIWLSQRATRLAYRVFRRGSLEVAFHAAPDSARAQTSAPLPK